MKNQLSEMIEAHGLYAVLDTLADICKEKGQGWEVDADICSRAANEAFG